MALYRRGRFWHYEFQVNGNRYRGSTNQTIQTRARQVEVRKMQEAQENGYSPMPKKPPILRDFAATVLKRFDNSSLDPDTKRYYRNGWSRLEATPLAGMRLDWITSEVVDSLQFDGSPSWQNQALRTLSVILAKGVEHRFLYRKPTIKLKKEMRRECIIDDTAEELLLQVAVQPPSACCVGRRRRTRELAVRNRQTFPRPDVGSAIFCAIGNNGGHSRRGAP